MINNIRKEKDIFDKIIELPGLRIFQSFYKKYKEILLYLFFGGLTMIVSIVSYAICNLVFGIDVLVANIISWLLAVMFSFYTNRIWVFQASTNSISGFLKQMVSFYSGRVATLIIEEIILFIFITYLQYNSMVVKIIAQVVVVILNYVISKLWVFRKL